MSLNKPAAVKTPFVPKAAAPCKASNRCVDRQFQMWRSTSGEIQSVLQSQPYSRSITNLPNGNFHDGYSVVQAPPPGGMMPTCNHRMMANRYYPARVPVTTNNGYCVYNVDNTGAAMDMPKCTCDNSYKQYPMPPPPASFALLGEHRQKSFPNGCYSGYDLGNRVTDEEDSAFPALLDREFHILHHNVPALRRTGVDTTTIRQHFYPDGGWGWIICSVSFLAHILTSGLQLSYGLLLFYAIQHLHNSGDIEWLGALSWSVSLMVTPFVITFCRKKSTRLLAVVGGLVLSLGILFTSFATEFGQILFSYGIVVGIGVAMVRESSTIMLGNYFKKRRQFVEMVAMSGEGVGIALFSVILKEGIGEAGWRFGLQIIAALVSVNFFMGLLYRPASLYHPQRRAIQHLKNQRKKVREKKLTTTSVNEMSSKSIILDFTPMKSITVKIILLTSCVASLGIYAPIFSMSINSAKEGSDIQDLVLLQTFLGMATALGVVLAGTILRKPIKIGSMIVTTQIITQVFISTVALSILFLSFVMGYRGICILSWIYGIGFGGFRYSIKILALERIKIKHFSKAWGLIKGAESIPVLISVPLTSFLNDYSLKYGRAGYYICSAAAAIAGIIIFFISYTQGNMSNKKLGNGEISTMRTPSMHYKPAAEYFYNDWEYPVPDLVHNSCISLNQVEGEPNLGDPRCPRNRISRMRHHHNHNYPYHFPDESAQLRYGSVNRQRPEYKIGQGSVGARMGRRLQKSLSFINYPYREDEHWACHSGQNYDLKYQQQPLICTCSPTSQYNQSSKSRSVPEGLSSISQQCSCSAINTNESMYLPRIPMKSPRPCCTHCHLDSTTARRQRQRSQSLSKPFHYVEQITTSV